MPVAGCGVDFSTDFNMLRVITLNLNGIRSAVAKGFLRWLARQNADCVCMQEIKAHRNDLPGAILVPGKLEAHFDFAHKKGYSGVGMYCRRTPDAVSTGLGSREFDTEGRFLRADFGRLSIVSMYLPSGSSSAERQQAKFRFLAEFMPHLRALKRKRRDFILCGDWNIAHKEIDLRNWRSNQKNSGFLPQERAWLDQLFGDVGYVDGFREINPKPDQYTFWSSRGEAWAKNVGWRIDYQILSPGLRGSVLGASIYKKRRFSDHAPLVMDYDFKMR